MSPELERRAPQTPRRGALVGGAGGEHTGLIERTAGELEAQRKAVAAEAAAHGERGLAGDVERHGERGLVEEVEDRLRLLEDLGRAPLVGGHYQVVAAHGRARVELQLAAEAQGRDVLLGRQDGAELEAAARGVAEFIRALDHLLAMEGGYLARGGRAAASVIGRGGGGVGFL